MDPDLNAFDFNFSQIKQAIDITRAKSPSRMFVSKKPFQDFDSSFGNNSKSIVTGNYSKIFGSNPNY